MQTFYESAKKRKDESDSQPPHYQSMDISSKLDISSLSPSKRPSILQNIPELAAGAGDSPSKATTLLSSSKGNASIQSILNRVNSSSNAGGVSRQIGASGTGKISGLDAAASHKDIEQDIYARMEKKNIGATRAGKAETQSKIMDIIKNKNKNT
jgi:hypothetical protein